MQAGMARLASFSCEHAPALATHQPSAASCPARCRAARLEALGLASRRQQEWRQRLAALDALVACLGFPAAHALLVLAPTASEAAQLAAAAVAAAGGRSVAKAEGGPTGPSPNGTTPSPPLAPAEGPHPQPAAAAATVRWFHGLRARCRLPGYVVESLAARGLYDERGAGQ